MLRSLQDTMLQATTDGSFNLFIPLPFNKFTKTVFEFFASLCHFYAEQTQLVITEEVNKRKLIILQCSQIFELIFNRDFSENKETIF